MKKTKKQKAAGWKKIISREYGVQYTEMSLRSLGPRNKFIVLKPFYDQIYIPEDGNETCYMSEEKWNSLARALKKKYFGKPENYEAFERAFMEAGNDYVETSRQLAIENLKKKSDKELRGLYLVYQKKALRYASFIWIQFIINNFFADRTKAILSRKLGEKHNQLQDFCEFALKPDKKSASLQLVDIASRWRKARPSEKLEIYQKFSWIPCLDIHNRPWTKEEFFSHISDFQRTEKASPVSYELFMRKIKPTPKEKQIFDITKRLAYLKDLKDDFRRRGVFYGRKLFKEIARRMDLKLGDISFMLESEIIRFLGKGEVIRKDIIQERRRGFVIFFTQNRKIVCRSGTDTEPALAKLKVKHLGQLSKEIIKGISASSGKARGVVTIAKRVSELGKIRRGDVLVAVTTHPDYVPAMQKAVAIVTDEGGLTSHAAIVSRELKIPCVIGTKIATQVLKDGDLVEVDANNGTVKILKRARKHG